MTLFNFSIGGERLEVEAPELNGYKWLFYQVLYCYYLSAKKAKLIKSVVLSRPLLLFIQSYFQKNSIDYTSGGEPGVENKFHGLIKTDPKKHAVMLTSGKDSVHLLKFLVEKYGAENIIGIYVDRINKSEAIYEAAASKILADLFQIQFKKVEVTNSIDLNREGHNIGLRDQLLLTLALPFIFEFGAAKVWYGVTHHEQPPQLWTETQEAHQFVLEVIRKMWQVDLEVHFHCENGFHEFDILRDAVQDLGLLSLTSSCYCQKNFREHRNDLLTSKFPKQYLYHGCGSCVKCMRINGGILAFTSNFTRDFAQHWFKQIEKYPQDETLNSLRPLVADKFERK